MNGYTGHKPKRYQTFAEALDAGTQLIYGGDYSILHDSDGYYLEREAMSGLFSDLAASIEGLEHARVADFVRYVNRREREDKLLADMRFHDGWLICLGGYAEMVGQVVQDQRKDAGDDPD